MSTHIIRGQQCQAIDMSQLADILADPEIETLFEIDNGGIRAFVCHGKHEGDFLAFQCAGTGEAFITQSADQVSDSVHAHARAVLATRY